MSIFDLSSPLSLAAALQDCELELPSGATVTITEVDAYKKAENDKPSYRAMFEMSPGDVYTPNVMGHPMFLIVCRDGKETGGCVRIRAISSNEETIQGAGRVGNFIGFEHAQTGRIIERAGLPLLLQLQGSLSPKKVKTSKSTQAKKPKGPLSSTLTASYMNQLTAKYREVAQSNDDLSTWLESVRATHNTEVKLKRFLGL